MRLACAPAPTGCDMAYYRCYFLSEADSIIGVEVLANAHTDAEALIQSVEAASTQREDVTGWALFDQARCIQPGASIEGRRYRPHATQ